MAENGKIIKLRLPCNTCGSSDAVAMYEAGDTFCFKCRTTGGNKGDYTGYTGDNQLTDVTKVDLSYYYQGQYKDITERRIPADVCKKYGVRTNDSGHHMFPGYNSEGELIAVKTCIPQKGLSPKQTEAAGKPLDPNFKAKTFSITGPWGEGVLFGANSFPKTGKSMTITEGEYDAMAAYRMTGSKYPHTSILNGCSSARTDMENNFDALSSFESIVFNFDNDKPGKEATDKVAPMFPGKSKILQLTEAKDACDYLKMNKSSKYVDEFFRAKTYTLGGIVNGRDTLEAYRKKRDVSSIAFPDEWTELNAKTYGVRLGEIVLVTAGTGSGKTQWLRELKYWWLTQTTEKIMDISLEEDTGDSAGGMMALHANKRIMLPDVHISESEEDRIHRELFSSGRMLFLDHEGSFEDDSLLDKINYAATVEKCTLIFLDHITIAVSDGIAGQENMTMDKFMNRLLKIAKRLNVCIVVVSHLRKTGGGGKSFEEGRIPSEDDLKGSGSLKQIAMTTIALSRNKYANCDKERNTTAFHVLKCRFTGRTGPCDHTFFDDSTGRMTAVDPETFFDADSFDQPVGGNNRGVKSEF